jgi:hypothetical protein
MSAAAQAEVEPKPRDASFKPAEYLKDLDEMEEKARDDSVFVPTEKEFTKEEQEYVRTYVGRRWREYMDEYCLPAVTTMRGYLNTEKPAESKEFETLIFFKHRARFYENTCNSVDFLILQRYYPEDLMDNEEYEESEDGEERWRRHQYLDKDGYPLPAPPSDDPVETDPRWADISDYVREYALTAFARKLGSLVELCQGAEVGIRSDQRTRQVRTDREKRGVKQITKVDGNRYTVREIPIDDPVPEGFKVSHY